MELQGAGAVMLLPLSCGEIFFIHITAKNTADYENYGTYWNNLTEIS